jgi:hypothetical protein
MAWARAHQVLAAAAAVRAHRVFEAGHAWTAHAEDVEEVEPELLRLGPLVAAVGGACDRPASGHRIERSSPFVDPSGAGAVSPANRSRGGSLHVPRPDLPAAGGCAATLTS